MNHVGAPTCHQWCEARGSNPATGIPANEQKTTCTTPLVMASHPVQWPAHYPRSWYKWAPRAASLWPKAGRGANNTLAVPTSRGRR